MTAAAPTLAAVIVGNLDCEVAWSGGAALPAAVVARLARLATTLRAFAPAGVADDDVALWLPALVPAAAIAVDDGPRPRLVSGAWPRAARVLPWGALAAHLEWEPPRRLQTPGPEEAGRAAAGPASKGWRDLLWSLAPPSIEVARAASDRRLAHALAAELGVALPGATTIASVDELRAHLAVGGADASPSGTWVVKAVVTAAGRERVRRAGATLDDATATRVARLCAQHGALVFEPWLDRLLDVAIGGVVLAGDRAVVLPPHRPWCDRAGVVRGVIVDDGRELDHGWRGELARVARAVAARLGALGYRGAFVVDGFVHRAAGGPRLHPLCEINPRLTFGLCARAWSERAGAAVLGLGGPPPPSARPLVLDEGGGWAAWLAADEAVSE